MKTQLTPQARLRYWARALRKVTDFYQGGARYHGAVKIKGGRLLALEIGRDYSNLGRYVRGSRSPWVDLTEHFSTPSASACGPRGEIYPDVPESVALQIYRANREAQRQTEANSFSS